jgi:Tol biopolymer transport system component
MSDDEFRRRLDRLANDAPSPVAERRAVLQTARRRTRIGMAVAGVVGATAIVLGVVATNIVIDRPHPPAPSVVGPPPTGTAVSSPTQSTTPPPAPMGALAFWSDSPTGGSAALTLINADGTHRQTIGDLSISTSRLSLSPDGSQAVFDHGMGEGDGQLDVIDLTNGQVRTIFTVGVPQSPDWAPLGDRIVFGTDRGSLFTVPAAGADSGTAVRVLGPDEFFQGLSPSWSPDAKEIASIDVRTGAVQVISVEEHGPATTFDVGGQASGLDWGVGGIVVSVYPEGGGASSLVLLDPTNGSTEPLPDEPGDENNPAISPDGMFVAFAGSAGGQQDIYVVRLSDGRRWRTTNDQSQDLSPVWLPGS